MIRFVKRPLFYFLEMLTQCLLEGDATPKVRSMSLFDNFAVNFEREIKANIPVFFCNSFFRKKEFDFLKRPLPCQRERSFGVFS